MNIVMTLLVRDEQDIIRENLEFHLSQGISQFIVTDNRSVDKTAAILGEYEDRGVLRYIFEDDDTYNQQAWVTRMAVMAHDGCGADWVINSDADEFWWPRTGKLPDVFAAVPDEVNLVLASRTNFVTVAESSAPFYERMVYRQLDSVNEFGVPLLPKVAHRGSAGIRVKQGNHNVSGFTEPRKKQGAIDILHFPMRTYAQFVNKIVKGGAAYERNRELPRNFGRTWRKLYAEYRQNNDLHEHFSRHVYDAERLAKELDGEIIVRDTRLADYMRQINRDF